MSAGVKRGTEEGLSGKPDHPGRVARARPLVLGSRCGEGIKHTQGISWLGVAVRAR